MAKMITGRRLDHNGQLIDGTGFKFDTDDYIAELLRQRNSPLCSQPITGEWIFGLKSSEDTNGEYERGVDIFPAGNAGPPEHYHPTYDEHFEIITGEFLFTIVGTERTGSADDILVVPKATPHKFRCVGG